MNISKSDIKAISRKNRTVELKDGRKFPLPDDIQFDLFGSEAAKEKQATAKEDVLQQQKMFSKVPGGEHVMPFAKGFGESNWLVGLANKALDLSNATVESAVSGKGQENLNYFQRFAENYNANTTGRKQGFEEISKTHPISKQVGQGTGFVTGFMMPGPQNPATSGALMSAGLSEENPIQHPLEFAKDVGLGAGAGYVGGKAVGALENIAAERAALRKYPKDVAAHTAMEAEEVRRFANEMERKLGNISNETRAGVPKNVIDVAGFVDKNIGMTPLAGTTQANKLSSFFESLIKSSPEQMSGTDIKKIFSTLESRAAVATPEEIPIFNAFKEHLVSTIPQGAANNAVIGKYANQFISSVDKSIDKVINKVPKDLESTIGANKVNALSKEIKEGVRKYYNSLTPDKFVEQFKNGINKNEINDIISNGKEFSKTQQQIDKVVNQFQNFAPISSLRSPQIDLFINSQKQLALVKDSIISGVEKSLSAKSLEASLYERDIFEKLTSKISNAVGVQNPLSKLPPTNFKTPPSPPPIPPNVGKMSRFIEDPALYAKNLKYVGSRRGGHGLATAGLLAMGIPHSGAVLTAGATAGGLTAALRGVTSPTAMGSYARQGIQQGSLRLIVGAIAEKYPSYSRGVIADPQERRFATAEIEQDPDLGLEDKAVLQARINRGQNIENLVKER